MEVVDLGDRLINHGQALFKYKKHVSIFGGATILPSTDPKNFTLFSYPGRWTR